MINKKQHRRSVFWKNRKEQTVMTLLRIEHCRLTHEHLLEGLDSKQSDICDTTITIEYLFY